MRPINFFPVVSLCWVSLVNMTGVFLGQHMKTLKPKIKTLTNRKAIKPRPTGNTLYALMKKAGPRLCTQCMAEGSVGNGDELDHRIPLAAGGSNDLDNLQWLCKRHHDAKTAEDREKWGGGV